MTEKIGFIKNPLTIIAIFAGIAEVSGTIVLPFVAKENQRLFIYFLISFPFFLVLLFFCVLWFKSKVLYAPSDFQDEKNYITVNQYDKSELKNIEYQVEITQYFRSMVERLSNQMNDVVSIIGFNKPSLLPSKQAKGTEIIGEFLGEDHWLQVSNFRNVQGFVRKMKAKDFDFYVYNPPDRKAEYDSFQAHASIWLGINIQLQVAREIILDAKTYFPHLKYIHIEDDSNLGADSIYIGGSTDTALERFHLKSLSQKDFEHLNTFSTTSEFHDFILSFNR